jgi:hypothetical protein
MLWKLSYITVILRIEVRFRTDAIAGDVLGKITNVISHQIGLWIMLAEFFDYARSDVSKVTSDEYFHFVKV